VKLIIIILFSDGAAFNAVLLNDSLRAAGYTDRILHQILGYFLKLSVDYIYFFSG